MRLKLVADIRTNKQETAMQFNAVQSLVAELIKGKILVGHALWQDLSG